MLLDNQRGSFDRAIVVLLIAYSFGWKSCGEGTLEVEITSIGGWTNTWVFNGLEIQKVKENHCNKGSHGIPCKNHDFNKPIIKNYWWWCTEPKIRQGRKRTIRQQGLQAISKRSLFKILMTIKQNPVRKNVCKTEIRIATWNVKTTQYSKLQFWVWVKLDAKRPLNGILPGNQIYNKRFYKLRSEDYTSRNIDNEGE